MEATQIAGPLVLFLLMIVVGLELTPADFRRVLASPRAVVIGTLGQIVLLPLMTWGVVAVTGISPVFGAGAVLVAVSPGAGMSNVLAALGHANTALSVTLTGMTSILAVVTLPLVASLGMELFLGDPGSVDIAAGSLVGQLLLTLLLPISLGMWLRLRSPERAAVLAPRMQRITMIAIGVIVVAAVMLTDEQEINMDGGAQALGAAILWTGAAMVIGWAIARALALDAADRFTFLIEFSTRNIAVAAIVAMSGLDRLDLTLFSGVYATTGYPMAFAAVALRRRRLARARAR